MCDDIEIAIVISLILCISIPCYTIFQSFYFTRTTIQKTVINTLVVTLSFLMEFLDLLFCSCLIIPCLAPIAEFLVEHSLLGCLEYMLVASLMWSIVICIALISVHRLLSTLFYGRYDDWSQVKHFLK